MNDEQIVLDFFAQKENLPLALIAAEHLDGVRLRLNNEFWQALQERLSTLLTQDMLPWECTPTEDRNSENCIVGLHLQPKMEQALFLRPFMEQQLIGGEYRIYYGLMWSATPAPGKAQLAQVMALREALQGDGFKDNENFLAWSWTSWYPRRRDFLLRFSHDRDELLEEAAQRLQHLVAAHGNRLNTANAALRETPPDFTISLDSLRANIRKPPNLQTHP